MKSRVWLLLLVVAACGSDTEETTADPTADTWAVEDASESPDIIASCEAAMPEIASLRIGVDGTRILDMLGRELVLRGVNGGGRSKLPPYFPFPFAEAGDVGAPAFSDAADAYVARVHDWGMNVVRLPFTWDAVEPTRGTYDETFLARYTALAEAFGKRGIRVIVDFHQDVFARPFCGDGFPLWAVLEPVEPLSYDCHQWFTGYTDVGGQVQLAFDHFWANDDGLRDAFADFWRVVAERLWAVDAVIGFEVINEPGWGTAHPGDFQKQVLTPFYTEMAAVIREVAPGAPIFFDSSGVDAVSTSTKLDLPDGGNFIFAPHYYDATVILQGKWTNRDADYNTRIGAWRVQADTWGIPVLLGEFGMRRTGDGAADYVRRNFEALDANRMHGTVWEYSTTSDDWNDEGMSIMDGEIPGPTAVASARAYPAVVSGTLVAFSYDAASTTGTLTVDAGPGVTELALNSASFPNGAVITVDGVEVCAQWHADRQRMTIPVAKAGQVTWAFAAR